MESAHSSNPYSPPDAQLKPQRAPELQLATRWQRLGGRVVDYLLATSLSVPLMLHMGMDGFMGLARDQSRDPLAWLRLYTGSLAGALTGVAGLALSMLYWYLITTRGQTPGKMLVGSRIVRLDGSPVGFLHGIVLRSWLLQAPSYALLASLALGAPSQVVLLAGPLGWLVGLSYLLVFGPERRCGHDYLASTKVVRAEA